MIFLAILLLIRIGSKRKKEIDHIREIISNISKNVYENSEEIFLDNSLSELENSIRQMYEQMKSDIAYLKKVEKVRSQFLGNVSHELRTPIFTIQGFIETLLDGAIDDERVNKSYLEKAKNHTLSLNILLNDLIEISMIESGEMRLSFRYFYINEFIESIVNVFKPIAEQKGIELVFIRMKNDFQVFGDKERLRQVFNNLLQNAIKYTDSGNVEILIVEEKRFGLISIKDTGIGIPEKDLDRVFERFYRVDKARSRAVGGTGLGLAIAKHIIEAHGSKIEVKSVQNEGSEFSFRLKK